jgi:AcrR family transcriptional regulator
VRLPASSYCHNMAVRPSHKQLPRAVREQQILDAAVRVFSRRGYHAASMEEIADLAGISKPMVYAYLGNKEEVFIACLRREGARIMSAVAEAVLGPASPGPPSSRARFDSDLPVEEHFHCGLRAFFRFVAEHRDTWAVLHSQGRRQEPFGSVIVELRTKWIEAIAAGLRKGTAAGPDVLPAAHAIAGAAESVADWLVEQGEGEPEELADRLAGLLWSGFAPEAPIHPRGGRARSA